MITKDYCLFQIRPNHCQINGIPRNSCAWTKEMIKEQNLTRDLSIWIFIRQYFEYMFIYTSKNYTITQRSENNEVLSNK
jgi:hypothetical protein